MFAPMFHPAMKYVQPIRKSLGFRTIFNILGPLANPADVPVLVLGVAEEGLMTMMAEALKMLGARYAMVVHSDGLDEINIATTTKILELKDGRITSMEMNPQEFGMELADIEDLGVTDAKTSAAVVKDILSDKDSGPRKDIVILNAAAAIIAAGMADDFTSAIKIAQASVSQGKASACLEKLIEISNNP
jgi:anthranilate phosphoribosyltransferase